MSNGEKIEFGKVLIIDFDEQDASHTEQLLRIGAKTKYVYKERDPIEALDYLQGVTDPSMLPDCIFLEVNTTSYSSFYFLEKWSKMPEEKKKHCKIILTSIFFKFKTELNQRVEKFDFVKGLVAKPLDIKQIYKLGRMHETAFRPDIP